MKPKQQAVLAIVLLIGCTYIIIGLFIGRGVIEAQSFDDYGGFDECDSCHRSVSRDFEMTAHALSMFAPTEDKVSSIVADFTVGDTLREFNFPEGTRPFILDDVAFVIGSGRTVQRYVFQSSDENYQLLPAEWNVQAGAWQALSVSSDTSVTETCATCHTTGYDATEHQWVDAGVTCESCHGAGMTHIDLVDEAGSRINDEEEEAILAAIVTSPSAESCATCHSQTDLVNDDLHKGNSAVAQWMASPHSQPNADGDMMSCENCHLSHGDGTLVSLTEEIKQDGCLACHEDLSNPLMSGESIVNDVVGVPSAHYTHDVTCTSCHSSHVVTVIGEDQTITSSCVDCHSDTTTATIQTFVENTQTTVQNRVEQIQSVVTDTSPEWISTAMQAIEDDKSTGIHNIRYVSQLLDAVEIELGLQTVATMSDLQHVTATDPMECAECHGEIYGTWQDSYHANASLGETFQTKYAEDGQPSYCMSCHASGYDPTTEDYVFEGVVCSSCHILDSTGEHPPAPMPRADASSECGRCHSGEHASQYSEWLVSDHRAFNVDCVDCHTPHDNSLRLGDVNSTCADCHEDAMKDEIHMGADMTCVDCHMTKQTGEGSAIHHTMQSDPSTCADCHGEIHTLQSDPTRGMSEENQVLVNQLEDEMQELEEKANTNLQSGIVGGAVGSLVLIIFLFVAVRLGRIR